MRSLHWGQCFAAAAVLSLLLLAGLFGIGMAIQQRTIAPPPLDVQLGGVQLVAYTTHIPDCDPWNVTPCAPAPDLMLSPPQAQLFYVIWVLRRTRQLDAADEWQSATQLLRLPLHHR